MCPAHKMKLPNLENYIFLYITIATLLNLDSVKVLELVVVFLPYVMVPRFTPHHLGNREKKKSVSSPLVQPWLINNNTQVISSALQRFSDVLRA